MSYLIAHVPLEQKELRSSKIVASSDVNRFSFIVTFHKGQAQGIAPTRVLLQIIQIPILTRMLLPE